ncbi:hypothetical protein A8G00_13145 [Sphingobium sp. SA916]|nr:hypothetical protein A8G00_13145 [Sphingobium sp. SA916]
MPVLVTRPNRDVQRDDRLRSLAEQRDRGAVRRNGDIRNRSIAKLGGLSGFDIDHEKSTLRKRRSLACAAND